MFDWIIYIFTDHTIRVVALGAMAFGVCAGTLGSFAVLRQQSLLGDAISHATLPGIVLAFILTQSKAPFLLLLGAGLAGWAGTLCVMGILRTTRLKSDAALGLVLSVFFGLGLVLLSMVQRLPTASKAGLNTFLFGNAATLLWEDVRLIAVLSAIALIILISFWKEFKLLVFDADYARSIGLRAGFLDILLTSLIVAAIVVGLQSVGVVLMSAILVAPAVAARQWSDRLEIMVVLAGMLGALSGLCGALISSMDTHIPTGPVIVIFISFFVFISLFLAPNRGLVWDWLKIYRQQRNIRMGAMLNNLLLFSEISADPFHPHDIAALRAIGLGAVDKTMNELRRQGYVNQLPDKRWLLTPEGLQEARRWEKLYQQEGKDGA